MALQLLEGCLCTCLFLHDPLLQKKLLVSLTGYDKQNSACLWRLINERSGSNETMWNKSFDFIGDVDTSYISVMLSRELLGAQSFGPIMRHPMDPSWQIFFQLHRNLICPMAFTLLKMNTWHPHVFLSLHYARWFSLTLVCNLWQPSSCCLSWTNLTMGTETSEQGACVQLWTDTSAEHVRALSEE